MIRAAVAVLALGAAAACSAGGTEAAPAPVVRLASVPDPLVAGQRWVARLTVRPAAAPVLRATLGTHRVSVRGRATGAGHYAAILRLPAAGKWRLVAVVRGRPVALRSVRVVASYRLALPAQILALDDASLLVVERQGRDRILNVNARTGSFSVLTRGVPSPWGLARAEGARVIASGATGIYELDRAAAKRIAAVGAGPVAAAPGGGLYFAENARVGRVWPDGRVETLSTDVSAPHALVLAGDGSLVVSDSGNGRLLRLDPATHGASVIASGLRSPLGAIQTAHGGLLVVEYDTGRLLRVTAGATSVVVDGLSKPYALTEAPDGTLYIVESGDDNRPSGSIALVDANGAIARLRLVPA